MKTKSDFALREGVWEGTSVESNKWDLEVAA